MREDNLFLEFQEKVCNAEVLPPPKVFGTPVRKNKAKNYCSSLVKGFEIEEPCSIEEGPY
jgi:hypothetical protein